VVKVLSINGSKDICVINISLLACERWSSTFIVITLVYLKDLF
jgi:hypothetical protein